MAYVHVAGPHPFHDAPDPYLDLTAPAQHHRFANPPVHDPTAAAAAFYNPSNVPPGACDIKPRLTKEQHDILESHYQKQNKPNTDTKKGFADNLNVSLDKVNNWFQNRRAKAKQDAKKLAGSYNAHSNRPGSTLNFSSDSDASPSFPSADYFSMMQQCTSEEQPKSRSAVPLSQQHFPDDACHALPFPNHTAPDEPFTAAVPQPRLSPDMFDSPQELNRRTLTQEQFDAFAHTESIMASSAQFDHLHGISSDPHVLQRLFPDVQQDQLKEQDLFPFSVPVRASLPSTDSSVPSTISEQSMFSSASAMQEHAATTTSSDWTDSRSSSVSIAPGQEGSYPPVSAPAPQVGATTSQWQPGQSVPVDPDELQQRFREAAQRSAQQRQQQQQHSQESQHEQPLAWPADEAFVRRESHNSTMLAQQMSSFAIQTPQPQQSAVFKIPAPPGEGASSIAARRQRPRPAALGLASLRSQSYSGAAQPVSPGQQPQNMAAGQQLRRIRSSNVIGGVAPGRVMKSIPGSAQRSPLNWTFADSLTSPKAVRHASSGSIGNLAPPTPMSPGEQNRHPFPPWQSNSSGHVNRHESISETVDEHHVPHQSAAAATSQNVSSPPHTPMYQHQHQHQHQHPHQLQHSHPHPHPHPHPQHTYQNQPHFAPARVGSNVVTENTPPQSAPAAQQTFPADIFMLPHQPQPAPCHSQLQMQPLVPQQHFHNVTVLPQQYSIPAAPTYGPAPHYAVPVSEPQPQVSMQFSNGVPMVDPNGNLTLGFPPHMQQMQFVEQSPPQMQQQPTTGPQYNFIGTSAPTTGMPMTAQIPKQPAQQASELFVHEYSPPQDMKRQPTQRKVTTESGPRNYTFANQGPEHFEKDKTKKGQDMKSATTSGSSPVSAAPSS